MVIPVKRPMSTKVIIMKRENLWIKMMENLKVKKLLS